MQTYWRFHILLSGLVLISVGQCCDDISWKKIGSKFAECISKTEKELLVVEKSNSIESIYSDDYCRKLSTYLECVLILDVCKNDYVKDQEDILLQGIIEKSNRKTSWKVCQSQTKSEAHLSGKHVYKRSPVAKKRGGSRGSSRSSKSRIGSSIRKAFTGGRGGKGQKAVSTLFGGKKGNLGRLGKIPSKGVKRKGGFLRKAGKYAVIGLAAYGTYKLAKKMSKGLRRSYDEDDCWEYSYFRDQYSCNCGQCNEYRGASSTLLAGFNVLLLSITIQMLLLLL